MRYRGASKQFGRKLDVVLEGRLKGFEDDKVRWEGPFYEGCEQISLFFSSEHLGECMALIKPEKNPGLPYSHVDSRNDGILNDPVKRTDLLETVGRRLNCCYDVGSEIISLWRDALNGRSDLGEVLVDKMGFNLDATTTPLDATLNFIDGVRDPTALAYKGESRLLDKAPRLVCSTSVCDNLLSRLIQKFFLDAEKQITEHSAQSMAVGLDIITASSTSSFFNFFLREGPWVSSDVSKWEYCTTPQMHWKATLEWIAAAGFSLFEEQTSARYTIVALSLGLTRIMLTRVYVTVEGHMFTSVVPGIQESGKYATFSENSRMRSELAFEATGATLNKTAGDDCMEKALGFTSEEYISKYARLGVNVTDVQIQHDRFNFCSTTFTSQGSYQDNIWRSLHQDLHHGLNRERLFSFAQTFVRNPEYQVACSDLIQASPRELENLLQDTPLE